MLGIKDIPIHGTPDANRSTEAWQDETNADKYGNQSPEAVAFNNAGLEDLIFHNEHKFGDNYTPTVFLDIDDERYRVQDGVSKTQSSFDLYDLVLSTGRK